MSGYNCYGAWAYTDYTEQCKLDDVFFAITFQAMLGKEFVAWYDQCSRHGR